MKVIRDESRDMEKINWYENAFYFKSWIGEGLYEYGEDDSRYRLVIQGVRKNTPADCMSAVVNYSGNGGICNSGYSYVSYYVV